MYFITDLSFALKSNYVKQNNLLYLNYRLNKHLYLFNVKFYLKLYPITFNFNLFIIGQKNILHINGNIITNDLKINVICLFCIKIAETIKVI